MMTCYLWSFISLISQVKTVSTGLRSSNEYFFCVERTYFMNSLVLLSLRVLSNSLSRLVSKAFNFRPGPGIFNTKRRRKLTQSGPGKGSNDLRWFPVPFVSFCLIFGYKPIAPWSISLYNLLSDRNWEIISSSILVQTQWHLIADFVKPGEFFQ